MNEPAGSLFSDIDGSGASDDAARYLAFAAERAADVRRQGYERMEIGEGWSVLDVGCGLGEVCADLVELVGPSGRVVGVDVSEAMITRARERCGDLPIDFGIGDAEALVFEDATFDAVRAERVVQHVDDPATAVAEIARVVRPGGKVFVLSRARCQCRCY
jgi:ubiquinone/menaquinone biosynthesis C-methylase UbiE